MELVLPLEGGKELGQLLGALAGGKAFFYGYLAEGDVVGGAETVTTYKWEYGEPLYIRVLGEGLSKGKHKVQLTVATRTAYIPVPLVGVKVREVEIAQKKSPAGLFLSNREK